jgi:hypothetical protein
MVSLGVGGILDAPGVDAASFIVVFSLKEFAARGSSEGTDRLFNSVLSSSGGMSTSLSNGVVYSSLGTTITTSRKLVSVSGLAC